MSLLSDSSQYNAFLPASTDADQVKLHMHVQVAGYTWYANGVSDDLAIAVVILYMFIALAHTLWVLTTSVTSSSWDTVTEILTLALESPVSDALKGFGAGVERLQTYRRMIKVMARKEGAMKD